MASTTTPLSSENRRMNTTTGTDPTIKPRYYGDAEAKGLLDEDARTRRPLFSEQEKKSSLVTPISASAPKMSYTNPYQTVDIRKISSRLAPNQVEGVASKTFDFLFGPEAAVIGIAHDTKGWSWNVDNIRQQWSEEPLWVNALATTSLIGTVLFPAARAARSTMRFGKGLTKLRAGTSAEVEEIAKWKGLSEAGELNPEVYVDDWVKSYKDIDDDTISMLRKQEYTNKKYQDMKVRAERAENSLAIPLSPMEKLRHEWDKRFSQTYNAMINDAANGDIKNQFHDMHQKLWQNDTVGTILREMPGPEQSNAIYGYILSHIAPETISTARAAKEFGKLSPKNQQWADFYLEAAKKRQAEMLETGFITPEQYMRIGPAHLPALNKNTPDLGIGATTTHLLPVAPKRGILKTRAEGLVQKTEERKGILGKVLGKEKTIYEPTGLEEYETLAVQVYNKPRLISNTLKHRKGDQVDVYRRLKAGELITDPADMTVQGYINDGILHTNYQFLVDMVTTNKGKHIMTDAMVEAAGWDSRKMAKLGFVRLDTAGDTPTEILKRMIAKKTGLPEEPLPWIKKDVFEGIFGKEGMMYQGDRITGNLMDVLTTIYKTMKTALSPTTHFQNLAGNIGFLYQAGFNIAAPENMKLVGEMTEVFGKVADLNTAAKKAGLKGQGRNLFDADGVLKGIDVGKVEVNGRVFDMKDEMFDSAVRELIEESAFESVEGSAHLERLRNALRKDQYTTKKVIDLFLAGKKKAQLNDSAKWFDTMTKAYLAEDMIPKMTYYMHLRGKGLTRKAAVTEVARRLPMYGTVGSAIKYSRKFAFPWATFPAEAIRITKNNIMDHPLRMIPWLRAPQIMQSVMSGMGFAGDPTEVAETERQLPFWAQSPTTVIGQGKAIAALGGAGTGALVGAAAGAILGKSAQAAYAGGLALGGAGGLLAALSTDKEHSDQMRGAMLDFLPHSTFMLTTTSPDFGGEILPWKDTAGMMEQLPAEPFAILKPMVSAFSGQTAYGQPIEGGINKAIAGILGFMAPPFLQKYGFKVTTPDVPLWGDPTGISNVSRALIDTGNAIDPMTGRPGSMTNDFFINNFGLWKSYAATGSQQLANEALTERHLTKVRTHLSKNLDFHLAQQNEHKVIEILNDIQATYSEQYLDNPLMAQQKYTEWLKRHSKSLGILPSLRGWSKEEIDERLDRVNRLGGAFRNKARVELLNTLRQIESEKQRGG